MSPSNRHKHVSPDDLLHNVHAVNVAVILLRLCEVSGAGRAIYFDKAGTTKSIVFVCALHSLD